MNQNKNNRPELIPLFLASMEGMISDEDFSTLNRLLAQDALVREYYYDFIASYIGLNCLEILSEVESDDAACLSRKLWDELSEFEKNSPAVSVKKVKPKPDRVFIEKVEHQKTVHKFNKVSFLTAILSLAAVFFLLVFIHLAPSRANKEVAVLIDSLDAQWDESGGAIKNGMRLGVNSGPTLLRKGVAALTFDNNARMTVEGPAEFEILNDDRIKLNYGRIYSIVPKEAIGFSVLTPNALIIDLGTEFGVQTDLYGNTELHVVTGRTTLLAGRNSEKIRMTVSEGMAKRISDKLVSERTEDRLFNDSPDVSDIALNEKLFVRKIDSNTNFVWRGQNTIDLADIVGGGDGFGSGRLEAAVDPQTGMLVNYHAEDRKGDGHYVTTGWTPYIDGVFIPVGPNQVISSKGHCFAECPPTNGIFYTEIINGTGKHLTDFRVGGGPLGQLGGRTYGTADYPGIFMHANVGITFDLEAIRSCLPEQKIARFVSDAGLSSRSPRESNADFWVLVDGKIQFSRRGIRNKEEPFRIDIKLEKTDRFLTLITTDGRDIDYPQTLYGRATDSDWCVFAGPVLELTSGD